MKVLVLWGEANSSNLGVQALGAGTAALVRRVWPEADVRFQSYGPGDAPSRIGDPKRLARAYLDRNSELRDWMRTFDLVVDTRAGDSFAEIYGLHRLTTMTAATEFAHRMKVPVVIGPQTIGPFSSRRGRLLARRSLKTASAVLTRDQLSYDCAVELGRRPDALTTDVVFAVDVPVADRTRDVLFNVSGLLWQDNPHVDAAAYRRTVIELCRELTSAGRRISLLAHVLASEVADNDIPAIEAVRAELDHDLEVLVPQSLSDVRSMLATGNVVIGSRMHACLNGISVGTPAVPLAYSRKFKPLLDGIGWDNTVDLRTDPDPATAVLAALDAPDLDKRADLARERAQELLGRAEECLKSVR
ncbi:polysaccharide pyruvyl transferase family protein [Jatrophihabitans telluris]|uniref:Polysaccharide pyruvyl transferase family protein n=1 Tax=Jatrophihabitans telluris TaxID=2038343 RepID=A0ABY4R0J0_9ACTN|nr:polysaccharide pyruvyl transferase family protein [Jatrophihabitans telluris]UQX89359.1 polysaccharide pyruvyl transferase family protein [Jatrophihabitans telluris]